MPAENWPAQTMWLPRFNNGVGYITSGLRMGCWLRNRRVHLRLPRAENMG
jgi:hypothetical protein